MPVIGTITSATCTGATASVCVRRPDGEVVELTLDVAGDRTSASHAAQVRRPLAVIIQVTAGRCRCVLVGTTRGRGAGRFPISLAAGLALTRRGVHTVVYSDDSAARASSPLCPPAGRSPAVVSVA